MTALRLVPPTTSRDPIQAAIDSHGALRVLLAALAALLRPKARPPDAASLTAHMRRDVGLPPTDHAAPGPHARGWDGLGAAVRGPSWIDGPSGPFGR